MDQRGLDLHELAVMASTTENLIHGEAVGRLQAAYRLANLAPAEAHGEDTAVRILDTYMAMFVLGADVASTPKARLRRYVGNVSRWYPNWPET